MGKEKPFCRSPSSFKFMFQFLRHLQGNRSVERFPCLRDGFKVQRMCKNRHLYSNFLSFRKEITWQNYAFLSFLRFKDANSRNTKLSMQQDANQSGQETFVWHEKGYLAYGISMFLILSIGFVGNVLTLLVLKQREHRSRGVTPLMINVALADISIIVFGYPIAIQSTFRGKLLERSTCVWVAFINGTVGITSIFTLTEMVVMSYFGVKQVNTNTHRLSTHQVIFLIGSAWLYGSFCMFPPLLGWSRFVVTSSKISCCPDWAGKSAADISYNLLLVAFGFIFPLAVMIVCYHKIFR